MILGAAQPGYAFIDGALDAGVIRGWPQGILAALGFGCGGQS
jgi:hypothetical protein